MNNAFPDRIHLAPHDVAIKWVTDDDNDMDTCGEMDVSSCSISVCQGMTDTMTVETMLHEVVHFFLSGLPLSDEQEEIVANVLGARLTLCLRDNPEWIRGVVNTLRLNRSGRNDPADQHQRH